MQQMVEIEIPKHESILHNSKNARKMKEKQ